MKLLLLFPFFLLLGCQKEAPIAKNTLDYAKEIQRINTFSKKIITIKK